MRKVGIVPVEVGNYVTTQTEIVTLDDRSLINCGILDSRAFRRCGKSVGQSVDARAFAIPGKLPCRATITAIGSRVETDSRTLADPRIDRQCR